MPLNQLAFLFNRLTLQIYNIPIPLGSRPESEFLHLLDFHF